MSYSYEQFIAKLQLYAKPASWIARYLWQNRTFNRKISAQRVRSKTTSNSNGRPLWLNSTRANTLARRYSRQHWFSLRGKREFLFWFQPLIRTLRPTRNSGSRWIVYHCQTNGLKSWLLHYWSSLPLDRVVRKDSIIAPYSASRLAAARLSLQRLQKVDLPLSLDVCWLSAQ